MNESLKMYMGYVADSIEEGACLIFAHSAKEARQIGWPIVDSWFMCDFLYMRVKKIENKKHEYLYKEANQEKLRCGESHVIESPESCARCNMWGMSEVTGGICEECLEERHEEEGVLFERKG